MSTVNYYPYLCREFLKEVLLILVGYSAKTFPHIACYGFLKNAPGASVLL